MKILQDLAENRFSRDKEKALAAGNAAGREQLILGNLREAAIYASGSSQARGLSEGEVLSAAFDGLTAAIKNWDPARLRFFSYAKPFVRGALSRATRANCVVRTVREAEPLPVEEPEEEEISYVPPRQVTDHHEPDLEAVCLREEWQQVRPVMLEALDEKERIIIELSYIGGLNLREISDLLGVTRSDTHHVRLEALRKIRTRLAENQQFSRE